MLCCDNDRFVFPQCVPEESVASATLECTDTRTTLECSDGTETLQITEVFPKSSVTSMVSELRWGIFNKFQKDHVPHLRVTLLGMAADSLAFREIAYFILCLAVGGDHLALIDERRIIASAGKPRMEPLSQDLMVMGRERSLVHLGWDITWII